LSKDPDKAKNATKKTSVADTDSIESGTFLISRKNNQVGLNNPIVPANIASVAPSKEPMRMAAPRENRRNPANTTIISTS